MILILLITYSHMFICTKIHDPRRGRRMESIKRGGGIWLCLVWLSEVRCLVGSSTCWSLSLHFSRRVPKGPKWLKKKKKREKGSRLYQSSYYSKKDYINHYPLPIIYPCNKVTWLHCQILIPWLYKFPPALLGTLNLLHRLNQRHTTSWTWTLLNDLTSHIYRPHNGLELSHIKENTKKRKEKPKNGVIRNAQCGNQQQPKKDKKKCLGWSETKKQEKKEKEEEEMASMSCGWLLDDAVDWSDIHYSRKICWRLEVGC